MKTVAIFAATEIFKYVINNAQNRVNLNFTLNFYQNDQDYEVVEGAKDEVVAKFN